ncbi:MAG: ATP-binding cassette domain-containing protein [Acholeplasmataceae bacterium]|jgi:ABC-2 type transport system ATP-binding protein|nr:ATP-binding cassette domain-containing protein [Acholeplasmataceae bacterium]
MEKMISGILHKTFGDDMHVVFRHANIEIRKDEIYLLVGRNGVGKSTLLKILAKIENNHRDTITWDITPGEMSYMPSQLAYYPYMKVETLLNFHHETSSRFSLEQAKKHLESFSINPNKKIDHLSDGQKKILSYIISLSYQAKLYLIDEPFPNVDLVFDETFRKMILNAKTDENTFIISTHQISEFEKVASKIIFIKSKSEIEVVDVDDIRFEQNQSIESYIKSEMKRLSYENQ